jgi:hypothetical protein
MGIKASRIPVEVPDTIMQLAAAKGVVKAPPAAPGDRGQSRGSWGVIDYFKAVASHLEAGSRLVDESWKTLSTR